MANPPEEAHVIAVDTSRPFDTASWNYDDDLPCNDLYFIREKTDHNCVDLYKARARSDPPYVHAGRWTTGLESSMLNHGSVLVHGASLYYFNTRNTSGEVQCVRFSGDYKESDFVCSIPGLGCDHDPAYQNLAVSDGKIVVSDGDIYFIKLRNTRNEKVELRRWTYTSTYQTSDVDVETPFSATVADEDQWDVWAGRLVHIQTIAGSNAHRARIQATSTQDGRNDHTRVSPLLQTLIHTEGRNGKFYVTSNSDVIFVKVNGDSKFIEIQVHDHSKGLISRGTAFPNSFAALGTFHIDKASFNPQLDGDAAHFKWMSFLPNDTRLTTMTIPGTHESHATYNNCPPRERDWAQTQNHDITRQLQYGVRYVDFRIGEGFEMRRRTEKLEKNLKDCAKEVADFLKNHPTETVLIGVKWDQNAPGEPSNIEQEISRVWNENGWYAGNDWPILGNVRKQAILLRRFEGSIGIDCRGFVGQHSKEGPPGAWHQQDDGTTEGGKYDDKYNTAREHIEGFRNALRRLDHIMAFTNIAGYDGTRSPRDYANHLNPRLMEYVRELDSKPSRLGVIIMDFIEREHASAIISWNFSPHRRSRS